MYISHDNATENKILIKITNDSQRKLGVTAADTGKDTTQQNKLAELAFADIAVKARAMMVQASLPEEFKYKLCKECFNCAMCLSNLSVVSLNNKTATRYEHFQWQNHAMPNT